MDNNEYFWQGKLVRLRPLTVDDAEQAMRDRLDTPGRQVLQLGLELPITLEAMRSTMARYADCKEVDGVILFNIDNLEGASVGGIAMHSMDIRNGVFSFGITVQKEFRGCGYALEAARILLRYGFHERRFQKCNSACVHTNQASIKLHRKLGFIEEGLRRRAWFFNGQYYDDLLWGMTREEFDHLYAGGPI